MKNQFFPFKTLLEDAKTCGMTAFPPAFIDHEQEEEMKRVLYAENQVRTRIALILGMFSLVAFTLLGNVFLPEHIAQQLTVLRIGFDLSFLVLIFGLTYTKFGKKHFHKLLGTAIIWVCITINLSQFVDPTPVFVIQYYPALLLLLFFGYVFIRGNWYTAIATGVIIQFVYLVLSPFIHMPMNLLVTSNIFILSANMVGAIGNYIMEYSFRREYWLRKQLEIEQNKLEYANQKLDALVNRRTSELKSSNAFLENLSNGAATDLMAPLYSTIGYFELIVERNQHKMDATSKNFVSEVYRQGAKLKDMLESLVDYSRLQESQKRHTNVDINMILQIALQQLKPVIEEKNAKISIPPLPVVNGDEVQLVILFRNLIENALQFNGEDPPFIKLDADYNPKDESWIFSVEDQGIGIAQENQSRLFEFFTRLSPETDLSRIGMGLAICKRIVEMHDGKIWIESQPGKGTTVFFILH